MSENIKDVLQNVLEPLDRIGSLECDGFARAASFLLQESGITHHVYFGQVEILDVTGDCRDTIAPHYWLILPEQDFVLDYRLKRWTDLPVPHGIFVPPVTLRYLGEIVDLKTSRIIFDILTSDLQGATPIKKMRLD